MSTMLENMNITKQSNFLHLHWLVLVIAASIIISY